MKPIHLLGMISAIILIACSGQNSQGSQGQETIDQQVETTPPSLDGRTFIADFHEEGKEESSKDTLVFANGTCHSTMCDQYGFSKASYAVGKEGENLTFKATTVSKVDGEMVWSGTVVGDRIEGTVVWNKEGQNPVNYRFAGALQ